MAGIGASRLSLAGIGASTLGLEPLHMHWSLKVGTGASRKFNNSCLSVYQHVIQPGEIGDQDVTLYANKRRLMMKI